VNDPMPAIFFGHGNPMNAVSRNAYTDAWAALGRSIPRPAAVLAISAHWYTPYCAVTANALPRTIHDFGGFPKALYQVEYPAPGSADLARRVQALLAPAAVELDESWGLDHGTWSVLKHLLPEADIPVVQLSIDKRQPPVFHYETGRRLMPLRDEGVLVIGSGNIVHNLAAYAWNEQGVRPFDWAERFEQQVRTALVQGDSASVIDYRAYGQDAILSVPTPDHYLPLLYVLGLRRETDPLAFPVQGMDGGSISMLAVQVG
jgi:4,5-DOPA dioxygenase extradiol